MNYRHIYHAGNHTEILKHAVLVEVLEHLRRKDKRFFVLDTHAGLGSYDLKSDEFRRTGEALGGIGRVYLKELPACASYLNLVRSMNPTREIERYPGSPAIIQAFLRENDRLVACEFHPKDAKRLEANFSEDRRVFIQHRDGYQAIRAFLPPPERRGLVFVDPPFEDKNEFDALAKSLIGAWRRWPTGILVAWYPIKFRSAIVSLKEALAAAVVSDCLSVELVLRPEDDINLVGGGMILINPPWGIEAFLRLVGAEILGAFEASRGQTTVEWVSPPT